MKVVSYSGGLSSIRVVSDEIAPIKGVHLPTLFAAVAARYHCDAAPTLEEAAKTGARFRNGRMEGTEGQINIGELGVFNDGVSVVTTNTADSDRVLGDVQNWLQHEFHFREPTTTPIRYCQSDLVVKFANAPDRLLAPFAQLVEFVQSETARPMAFSRFAFGAESSAGPISEFVVERRVGVPWSEELYFSKASISTRAHIRALEMFDSILEKAA